MKVIEALEAATDRASGQSNHEPAIVKVHEAEKRSDNKRNQDNDQQVRKRVMKYREHFRIGCMGLALPLATE